LFPSSDFFSSISTDVYLPSWDMFWGVPVIEIYYTKLHIIFRIIYSFVSPSRPSTLTTGYPSNYQTISGYFLAPDCSLNLKYFLFWYLNHELPFHVVLLYLFYTLAAIVS
jgi:hypothetical protein